MMRNDVIQALRAHQQADAEGVMVLVSREACELAATLLEQRDAQPDERKAFEAWAMTQPRHEGANMRFLGLNNAYIDFDLHGAWLAWQARAAQVEPAPALKERPDFIAGYDAGLADGKRCAERDRVEPAPSPPAAQPEAWVSVEDQLPPANPINDANSQPVLFWGPAFKHGCEFGVLWYRAHGGSWNGSRGYDMNEVTHWLQPTLPLAAAAQEPTP